MERMVRDGALPLGTREKSTGFIETPQVPERLVAGPQPELPHHNLELVLAARGPSGQSVRTSFFYESPLPFWAEESLQALDCLVIGDDRLLEEPAAMAAVRRWLFAGGRVWVLLDQVDPLLLAGLLGDGFSCQVIDEVDLTQVKIDGGPAGVTVDEPLTEHEEPVKLVRLVPADMEVVYTVEGWPAALRKSCGEGQLLITTLAPPGWLMPKTDPSGAALTSSAPAGAVEARPSLRNLGVDFFGEPHPPLLTTEALEPLVREYIGYRIPASWTVVGLLGLFNLILVAAGIALWPTGRLDRMVYVIPVAALLVGGVLLVVGRSHRQGIPPTAARLQMVQVIPGTDDQRVWGMAGLFSPSTVPAKIGGTQGGWAELTTVAQTGAPRRLVWTDDRTWHWENLRQPGGLQLAAYESSATVSGSTGLPRLQAEASFGPAGLTGKLAAPSDQPVEDALVATSFGRLGVQLGDRGEFLASGERVMGTRQFLAVDLLSDEQNRRQRFLAELLAGQRVDYPEQPQFLFWTTPQEHGIRLGSQMRQIGASLVAVPLVLTRPEPGSEILVPSPFVAYRAVPGPDGTAATGLYDNRRRQWLERSRPSWTWLEFKVPPLLLPFEPTRARMVVEVTGPVKRLEIAAFRDGQAVPLATRRNPVGTIMAELTDREHLALAADGTVRLRITGGGEVSSEIVDQPSAAGRTSYWHIDSLRMELRGRVLEPASGSSVQ